jgi:hypothetical protein
MKATKQQRQTTLNELVETHNLALALRRLRGSPYDTGRWKRALYHALCMEGCNGHAAKIREALELP